MILTSVLYHRVDGLSLTNEVYESAESLTDVALPIVNNPVFTKHVVGSLKPGITTIWLRRDPKVIGAPEHQRFQRVVLGPH